MCITYSAIGQLLNAVPVEGGSAFLEEPLEQPLEALMLLVDGVPLELRRRGGDVAQVGLEIGQGVAFRALLERLRVGRTAPMTLRLNIVKIHAFNTKVTHREAKRGFYLKKVALANFSHKTTRLLDTCLEVQTISVERISKLLITSNYGLICEN